MSDPHAKHYAAQRNGRGKGRAGTGRAADRKVTADRFDAVDQTDQTGSVRRVGATGAIVGDRQVELSIGGLHTHLDLGRMRMPRRVGKRFSHNVIGGDLHPVG